MPPPVDARPSDAQLGIWLGHHRAGDSSIYNAAECVVFDGPFDVDAFVRALEATITEASALHVAFPERHGEPFVVPIPAATACERVELAGVGDDVEAALDEHGRAVLRRPLDILAGELFRHQVIRIDDTRHAWLHVAHHIALDGFGFALVARRVAERYAAEIEGTPAPPCWFTPLGPVLEEDEAYRRSEARARDRAFWRTELAGSVGSCFDVTWAPDHARRFRHRCSDASLRRLQGEAARWHVGWSDVLTAIVAARMLALTSRHAFAIGLPVMLRLGTAALRTPCMAMNICCLPVEVDGDRTRIELVRAVGAAARRHKAHRRHRYEHLRGDRAALGSGASPFGPLVNIMAFDVPRRFGAAAAEPFGIAAGPIEDLSVSFHAHDGQLDLTLDGHAVLFAGEDLRALAVALERDLDDWITAPDRRLGGASRARGAGDHEARDLMGTSSIEPVDPGEAVRANARARPHAVAIVEGRERWSYAQLDAAVQHCARRMQALGAGPGRVVAIALPRSMLAVVAMLAAWRAGAAYLVIDPRDDSIRTKRSLELAHPTIVVRRAGTDVAVPEAALELSDAELAAWAGSPEIGHETGAAWPEAQPSDPAYVVFTSGSTGEPKGAVVGHGAVRHFVAAALASYGFRADDRVLQFAPLTFDACVEELWVTLAAGATVVLRDDAMLDAMEAFLRACRRLELSILDLPTAFWHELVYAMKTRRLAWPEHVRMVIIGGEAAVPERVRDWHAVAPSTVLLNTYGPTEATVVATWAVLRPTGMHDGVPIGVPLPGVRAIVCDEHGEPVRTPEAKGELWLAGPTLAIGYLGRDDLTRERFAVLPGHGRAYRTGDLVSRGADGRLVHRGRVDDELKVSGHRIAPAEIEAVLVRDPDVRAAVVVGEPTGTGALRLVAVVEADPARVDAAALRRRLSIALPPALVPSAIEVRERLPRTRHGKLDRAAVRTAAPEASAPPASTASHAVLETVLDAWRTVLGRASIGLDDDFFAVGGTSLQVIALANRLSRAGAEILVAEIFRNPTVRMQAQLLTEPGRRGPAAFEPWRVDLPSAWFVHARSAAPPEDPRPALLTGATGFLGVHVLSAWLERTTLPIVCLVRGKSLAHARARLDVQAEAHGLSLAAHGARVIVVAVDLTAPDARRDALLARIPACRVVLHCAADVSVTRDYASLAPANVLATRELVGVAAHWGAAFHLASTIAVAPAGEPGTVVDERFFALHAGLVDGYSRSKWHAEWLCEQAGAEGLPVAVHRFGRICGPRRRPGVNPNDLVWRIARAAVHLGLWPDLPFEEPWIPADVAGETLVCLALTGAAESPARAFHLVHTGRVRPNAVRDALADAGLPLAIVPPTAFADALRERGSADDQALTAFFEMHAEAPALPADFSVRALLSRLPEDAALPVDASLLSSQCRAAIQAGLLPISSDPHP